MDCYEALNEQQVDLAQQLKGLVADAVQVGGRALRLMPFTDPPGSCSVRQRLVYM
jgi:predicted xylose isomerase-like sugar epimerase